MVFADNNASHQWATQASFACFAGGTALILSKGTVAAARKPIRGECPDFC
jgi:hypothetical protein